MTDVSLPAAPRHRGTAPEQAARVLDASERDTLVACAELLFFAYRDFTGDPDAVLATYRFGRAHHRVLHFVNRNPGLTVAQLLDILRITKQSLARVLKQLIDQGFVAQRTSPTDRRERLLYLTPKGGRLAERLSALQLKRLREALRLAGDGAIASLRTFLLAMICEKDRTKVASLVGETGEAKSQEVCHDDLRDGPRP